MNRRNFIEQSSFMAAAIAGLPLAMKSKQQVYPIIYKNELLEGKSDQTQFTITIYHNAVESFDAATAGEKMVLVNAKHYATAQRDTPTRSGEFKYMIRSVKQTDKSTNTWKVIITLSEKVTGDYEFPSSYPKEIVLSFKPSVLIDLLSTKGKTLVTLPFHAVYSPSTSGGDTECFLTTACVEQREMPDDCLELQTLRYLRDNHMMTTSSGRLLEKHYRIVGPAIVKAIDNCHNKSEIYEYMFHHMITPAVKLVQLKDFDGATAYYAAFVKALKEKYCDSMN